MNLNAVPHACLKVRSLLAVLAAGAMLLASFCGSASAAPPVGKDGVLHACYRVKGKPKGTLRVVPAKKRCKRGERKVAWNAVGSSGQTGADGQSGVGGGGSGQQGQPGTNGSPTANEIALKTQVAALALKLEGLERVLAGVDNAGLTHAVDAVKDVTASKLLDAVDAAPLVEEVCAQTEALTGRSNALLGLLDTLDALDVLTLPATLPVFDVCP